MSSEPGSPNGADFDTFTRDQEGCTDGLANAFRTNDLSSGYSLFIYFSLNGQYDFYSSALYDQITGTLTSFDFVPPGLKTFIKQN